MIEKITTQKTTYNEVDDDLNFNEDGSIESSNADNSMPDIDGGSLLDNMNLRENIPEMDNFTKQSQIPEEKKENEPIYKDSPLTIDESALLIMAFAVRHKISSVALEDLLKLIELHCPKPNKCTTEIKEFKSFFQALKHPIVYHYYCPNIVCQMYTGTSAPRDCDNCTVCNTTLSKSAYFLEIPIAEQIKTIFSREYQQ